jgi:allantoinase
VAGTDATQVVRGATAVLPDREEQADVVCRDGVVVRIGDAGSVDVTGLKVVDADGLLLLPGAVDPHVHFDEPGRTEWEGFDTGSAAAAAGGITTVVDMPIDSDPPTTTAAEVTAKIHAARRSSRCDVALWGGLVPASVGALDELLDAGVVGFKAFACPSGWDDFPAVDEPALRAGLALSARTGRPVALHAELAEHGHSVTSEVEAVRWAGRLAAETGGHLHVVHVSAIDAVDEARRWPNVTVETCPHYLVLDEDDVAAVGADARCNPPIRAAANRDALWAAVAAGHIGVLASDHSPCPPERKEPPDPWAGVSAVDTFLPSLLDAGRLDHVTLVRRTTEAARLLGLAGKGAIAVGMDADLVLVDPDESWTVAHDTLHSRHRRSPFVGRTLRGRVLRTWVRGRTVYERDAGPCDPGGARVLRPAPMHRSR